MGSEEKRGRKLIDLKGLRFGSYEVIGRVTARAHSDTLWLCRCTICGREAVKGSYSIRNGEVRNCECQLETYVPSVKIANVPFAFSKKYGCSFCADSKACAKAFRNGAELVCKYAETIDPYEGFDNYLRANACTLEALL